MLPIYISYKRLAICRLCYHEKTLEIVDDNIGDLVPLYRCFCTDSYGASSEASRLLGGAAPLGVFSYYAFGGQSSTNGTNDALRAIPACATDGIIYPLLSLQARFKRHLLFVRALPSRRQRCMYVNDKALSLTDNKNSCVEKLGHVKHTNYPLRLYHVPFHKLTVKKTC